MVAFRPCPSSCGSACSWQGNEGQRNEKRVPGAPGPSPSPLPNIPLPLLLSSTRPSRRAAVSRSIAGLIKAAPGLREYFQVEE
jgi:hypothetical protein